MPTVLTIRNINVRIYTNDHPPPHVHAVKAGGGRARFELNCPDGPVRLLEASKFKGAEIAEVVRPSRLIWRGSVRTGGRSMAVFENPSAADFEAITRRTEERMKHQLLAVSARYDRQAGRVMIQLNTGAVVGFPLAVLPGLENAAPEALRHIVVEGDGYGLRVEALDVDISVPQLLADQLGSTVMKRSIDRASASRANGRLGGRPRKAATS